MNAPKTHPQLEYAVDDASGHVVRHFKTFEEASGHAVALAASGKEGVKIDTLCWTREAAVFAGLEEEYDEDPDASVTCRLEVSVNVVGRVP